LKRRMRGRWLALIFSLAVLTLLTSCGTGLPSASWFGIAASDDAVYLAANEQVFAINPESGAEFWSFPPEPDREIGPFYATPALTNGVVIIGGFDGGGKLYAIAPNGGAQAWVLETGARIVAGVVSTHSGVIVGNGEGEVYLVDPETQEKRLLLKADEPIWTKPLVDETEGRLYVASMDHHLYAVDLERGEQLWAFKAGGALAGTPALRDGVIYFGALNSTFYAINAETADELWRVETEGWVWGGPLVDGDTIYFGDMDGKVYALDAADGSQRWTFEAEGGVRATPVLADGQLYFGTRGGKFYAVKAEDGTQQWMLPLDGSVYSQPVVHGDFLLVSPHNAKVQLVALDLESGAERWSYPPREE